MTDRVPVGSFDSFPDGEARRVDIGEHKIAVVRIGDRIHAIGDTCSHADYSLSEGEVDLLECALECPKHGSAFSLLTGEPESLPAIAPVPLYPASVDDGEVYIDVEEGDS